jgi:hypothetical protein
VFGALGSFPAFGALFFKGVLLSVVGPPFDRPIMDFCSAIRAGATLQVVMLATTLAATGALTTVKPRMTKQRTDNVHLSPPHAALILHKICRNMFGLQGLLSLFF